MAAPPTDSFASLQTNITQTAAANGKPTTVSRGPSPNRGASVPDNSTKESSVTQTEWLASANVQRENWIHLSKLSHMRYQHEDLDQITIFLRDFGMRVVQKTDTERWYAGYGSDQYVYYARKGPRKFLGGTFEVSSYSELEKAAARFKDTVISNGIEELSHAPGGGHMLTVTDPEGFPLNLIYGQTPAPAQKMPAKLVVNDESSKPRQRAFQRFQPGPAAIHKLGHFGLVSKMFPELQKWYVQNFNIVPSDILYVDTPAGRKEVAVFAHLDQGQGLVDHHTIFLSSLTPDSSIPEAHVHHCSFEVHDFDTQALGHQWLAEKGYKNVWGVGRHILGSQIFDYWWDTSKFMVEHYADGDLVNEDTVVGYGPAGHEGLAVWGPDVPTEFLH